MKSIYLDVLIVLNIYVNYFCCVQQQNLPILHLKL